MVATQQERYGRITRGVDTMFSVVLKHTLKTLQCQNKVTKNVNLKFIILQSLTLSLRWLNILDIVSIRLWSFRRNFHEIQLIVCIDKVVICASLFLRLALHLIAIFEFIFQTENCYRITKNAFCFGNFYVDRVFVVLLPTSSSFKL